MHPPRGRLWRLFPDLFPLPLRKTPKPALRLFTSKSPRLTALARSSARPQLPFLASRRAPPSNRLLSTEQKANIRYGIRVGIYWTVMGWTVVFGGMICYWFLRQDWLDRLYPSPTDWRFLVKWYWRDAKHELETDGHGRGMLDWSKIGSYYRNVVGLLEDYKFIVHRPSDLLLQDEIWDTSLPFADDAELHTPPPMFTPEELKRGETMWKSRIGYDITMKSEPWIRGYFEAMMGMAKGAEMREGYMTYTEDRQTYAPQHIRSDENPYPVPLPPLSGKQCPDITDCWRAFEDPVFHYKRILTTKGFNDEQRMEAGLAYASFLDHKQQYAEAKNMYQWSFKLALRNLPSNIPDEAVVNISSGIIKPQAPLVTPNVVACSSAYARHLASTERIREALEVYISVLRARRDAEPAPRNRQYPPSGADLSLKNIDSIIQWIISLPTSPDFPPPPPSGNEALERKRSEECEDAALSLYVAEILFAKMNRRREGLAWTRDATEIAQKRMHDKLLDKKGVKSCEKCVHEGLKNWKSMLGQLANEQKAASNSLRGPSLDDKPKLEPKSESWFWRGLHSVTGSSEDQVLLAEQDWVQEERDVAKRLAQFEEDLLNARLNAVISANSSWFVV
ncbi:MAG: hypothetical protein Q9162_003823 [Coniocarpon cinnabarinum]